MTWGQGEATVRELGGPPPDAAGAAPLDPAEAPRVQYLSQQFVERLCSAEDGITDELLAEIERVIYDSHPLEARAGTTDFQELLSVRASHGRTARGRLEHALRESGKQLNDERQKQAELEGLLAHHAKLAVSIAADKTARDGLIVGSGQALAARLRQISDAIEGRGLQLDAAERQRRSLIALRDTIGDLRARQMPAKLAELKRTHADAHLTDAEWEPFALRFSGDVDATMNAKHASVEAAISTLTGRDSSGRGAPAVPATPLFPEDADLTTIPLSTLNAEADRLRGLIGLDEAKSQKLRALDTKVARDEIALSQLAERIADARAAPERITALFEQRKTDYATIFDAILDEETQLNDLYAPLRATLGAQEGVIAELSFSVRRVVDVDRWAERGEQLLDLRSRGPFRGRGALVAAAREQLLQAWRTGSSDDVADAMVRFREKHDAALLAHSPVSSSDRTAFWAWGAKVSGWLMSTDHVRIRYGIEYDGVDVQHLSPGTRGIVLLLLYLSIDKSDDRPLIIDQPEENLDPKSVFDELVDRFRLTRLRRQVIIVTHNANLIVNTDADQVIVATAGRHRPRQLPEITYVSGGLENPEIRRQVCEILEGGEEAFRERARRLRVDLDG